MESSAGVPTLKFADFVSGDATARSDFARALRDAFLDFGFAILEQPPLPTAGPGSIGEVYRAFEHFFALDRREKNKSGGSAGGQRGYTRFGIEQARDHAVPDLKEFFHVGPVVDRTNRLLDSYPENIWPSAVPSIEIHATLLFDALQSCAMVLLEALELAEGLPSGSFSAMLQHGNHVLRALHYPPIPVDAHPASLRAAPHEDINLITLLCEASDPGLEILRPDGRWLPVEAPSGQLVVNTGDMLARITNGAIRATTHRVTNPVGSSTGHRYSLPFFAHPRPECDLSVLPQFITRDAPPRTPPITAGEFLAERLREIGLS
ncbi:MAG: 2OG-Fe(II) oxygenase family protein [Myxococcota bacterium]